MGDATRDALERASSDCSDVAAEIPTPTRELGEAEVVHIPARRATRIGLIAANARPGWRASLEPLFDDGAVNLLHTSLEQALDPSSRLAGVILAGESAGDVIPSLSRLREQPRGLLLGLVVFLSEPSAGPRAGPGRRALLDPSWRAYADAVLGPSSRPAEIGQTLEMLARLEEACAALRPIPASASPAARQRMTLLQFMTSRGLDSLEPQREPNARLGHAWPPLDLLPGDFTQDLDALARAGLLRRAFFERVHVCPACGDARLAFREVCAGCRSADVRRGEVLHHYRCGHVAAEESFRRGSALVCPSCEGRLRHVGIDYERPAELLYCRSCSLAAGEGVTQARCLACGTSHAAEAVAERVIWSYRITEHGLAAARDADLSGIEEPEA